LQQTVIVIDQLRFGHFHVMYLHPLCHSNTPLTYCMDFSEYHTSGIVDSRNQC